MHVFMLFLALLSACTTSTATAAAPPTSRPRADPAAMAALARDTAIAYGLAAPVERDRLELMFEAAPPFPAGLTIIRVLDRDHGTGLRIVFADDEAGVRAISAWPL